MAVELKCNFLAKNCEIFNGLTFIRVVKCVNSHHALVNLTVLQWMHLIELNLGNIESDNRPVLFSFY